MGDLVITRLISVYKASGVEATFTGVQPPGRFGALVLDGDRIESFQEKPEGDRSWGNGGLFVLEPCVFDRIDGDATIWERQPLKPLAKDYQLGIFHHYGFWSPMGTLGDKIELENLWDYGFAPWKTW